MSSHHEWAEEVTAQHDAQKPYAPENGQPLRFKAGDPVIYTNPVGIEFPLRVTGFYQRPASPCGHYANGARYLLDWDCPWFPVPESRLRLGESRAAPDLLAALQGLLRGISNGPDEANAAMLIAKARDAVNKATGEKE